MFSLSTPIQHHTKSPNQCNKARKMHTCRKGRNKIVIFRVIMIIYVENPGCIIPKKKNLELRSEFSKVI